MIDLTGELPAPLKRLARICAELDSKESKEKGERVTRWGQWGLAFVAWAVKDALPAHRGHSVAELTEGPLQVGFYCRTCDENVEGPEPPDELP